MLIIRYHGPTDTRGSRLVCRSPGHRARTYLVDYGAPDMYHAAATAYVADMRIQPRKYAYRTHDGTRVYIDVAPLSVFI